MDNAQLYCFSSRKILIACLSSSVNGIFTDVTMMSSLCTALPSTGKQEKYLITHLQCMLGPLQCSMPKITKSDAKLSEIYEQNEWHLFFRAM